MAGLYIHIPFCRQACHYCNFHFSTSTRYKNDFIAALLKEIDLFISPSPDHPNFSCWEENKLLADPIESIYFGGGTPSLCSIAEIKSILEKIKRVFPVAPEAEITLEANPDDIHQELLEQWKEAGINRLSIGIQSFFDDDLQWMNRAHHAKQAISSLELASRNFDNLSIDLIYGTPQLSNEKWKHNVEKALSSGIPHLSCYALTVEPKTPLDKMIRLQKSPGINPAKQSEQFLLLMQWLEAGGYEHYEISNFAKPGWRSRHNSSYWQGKFYYGFGPSAHSFNGQCRWWNISNNQAYIQSINEEVIPFEKETLTGIQQLNEYIMLSLRTNEGLDLEKLAAIDQRFKDHLTEQLLTKSKNYANRKLVTINNNRIQLTREGKLLADGIAADFFIDQW